MNWPSIFYFFLLPILSWDPNHHLAIRMESIFLNVHTHHPIKEIKWKETCPAIFTFILACLSHVWKFLLLSPHWLQSQFGLGLHFAVSCVIRLLCLCKPVIIKAGSIFCLSVALEVWILRWKVKIDSALFSQTLFRPAAMVSIEASTRNAQWSLARSHNLCSYLFHTEIDIFTARDGRITWLSMLH